MDSGMEEREAEAPHVQEKEWKEGRRVDYHPQEGREARIGREDKGRIWERYPPSEGGQGKASQGGALKAR